MSRIASMMKMMITIMMVLALMMLMLMAVMMQVAIMMMFLVINTTIVEIKVVPLVGTLVEGWSIHRSPKQRKKFESKD